MQIRSYMESNQGWNEIGVADSGLFVKIKGEEIYVSKEVKMVKWVKRNDSSWRQSKVQGVHLAAW